MWLIVNALKVLPHGPARLVGAGVAWVGYHALGRLRKVGIRNLALAFRRRARVERGDDSADGVSQSGWQLAEFCQMPKYSVNGPAGLSGMRAGELSEGSGQGQGSAGADGASGGVGAVELLSLVDGDADGDGDSAAG